MVSSVIHKREIVTSKIFHDKKGDCFLLNMVNHLYLPTLYFCYINQVPGEAILALLEQKIAEIIQLASPCTSVRLSGYAYAPMKAECNLSNLKRGNFIKMYQYIDKTKSSGSAVGIEIS
jgi:hypothetical protein